MVRFNLGGNLWNHPDFMRLWFSNTVVQFGTQFSGFALPVLAVLQFNASAFDLGLLVALAVIPYPVLGLFVGVWVDRFKKRRTMIICNFGRMFTLASVPVSYLLGTLSLTQIFAVALVNGVFSVFFDISYQAYLVSLVERKDLLEGNQKLQLSISGAQVAGPGIAGVVYQAIGGALTCLGDAIGYLVAAAALILIKKQEVPKVRREGESRPNFFAEMREGTNVVLRNPILRTIAACTATSNFGTNMVAAISTLFALKSLRFSPVELGLVGSIGAVGFLIGAVLVNRVTNRLGLGRSLAITSALGGAFMLSPLALYVYPFAVLATIALLYGASVPLYNINQVSLRQAITPDRLQGRMNATMRTIITSLIPVGSVIGGILGSAEGLVSVFYVGGGISALAAVWIVFSPVVKLKKQPDPLPS